VRNREKRKNDSSKGKRLLSVPRVVPRVLIAFLGGVGGWGGAAYVLALVFLFAYPAAMTSEIEPIESELLARLRVLEAITPRIRAAEAGLCACVTWQADDLGAGEVEIVGMERAG